MEYGWEKFRAVCVCVWVCLYWWVSPGAPAKPCTGIMLPSAPSGNTDEVILPGGPASPVSITGSCGRGWSTRPDETPKLVPEIGGSLTSLTSPNRETHGSKLQVRVNKPGVSTSPVYTSETDEHLNYTRYLFYLTLILLKYTADARPYICYSISTLTSTFVPCFHWNFNA